MLAQFHPRLPATFRALRHYNFRVWFLGQSVSLIGVWMQNVAQQVLIYRLTGSAAALGMVNFISLVPVIPLSLLGGSITDRYPRQRIVMICQVGMMLQAFLVAALVWTGRIQVWHIYLMSLILGMINAVDVPARQAFTVDMVEGKDDLTNAIGLNSAMFNGARAIGPAVAGLLVATTGEAVAFFINGLTFVAVLISLALMRNLPKSQLVQKHAAPLGQHILEGLRFIQTRKAILFLVSLIAISAFLSMPYSTLMPVMASQVLSNSAQPVVNLICNSGWLHCQSPEALPLGALLTTVGIGALVGALVVASLPDRAPRGVLLTAGNVGFPLLLFLFAISRTFIVSLALLFIVGISFVWQNALANTLLQFATPDALRGRVMSVYTMVFQSMMRLGGLQAGLMADWAGAPFSIAIGAVISLLYGVYVALRVPEVRQIG